MKRPHEKAQEWMEQPGSVSWIVPRPRRDLPTAPLIGEPPKAGFELDFDKIEKTARRSFDGTTRSRIGFYVDVFLSYCQSTLLDEGRARAEYRHLAHEINRHSASRVSRYFAELGRSKEPEKLAVVQRFRMLFPTFDTRWLRQYAPFIGAMRPRPRRRGRQMDAFSGLIAYLDLCLPNGTCYYDDPSGTMKGSFVDFVCEIVRQLKEARDVGDGAPAMRDSDFDFLPEGIMRTGMSDSERGIIGRRCKQVRDRLEKIGIR
jgi:hypothetical protein